MRIEVYTVPDWQVQSGKAAGLPRTVIKITGAYPGELYDPLALLGKARRVLLAVKPTAAGQNRAAKKVLGVLYAACLRAQAIRQWSSDPTYDPLEDYREIQSACLRQPWANSRS